MSADEDDLLAQATRALRDAGPPPLDELRHTRRRIMEAAGRQERAPRRFTWVVFQLAAFLLAATALAATTGRLAPMVDAVRGLFMGVAPHRDDAGTPVGGRADGRRGVGPTHAGAPNPLGAVAERGGDGGDDGAALAPSPVAPTGQLQTLTLATDATPTTPSEPQPDAPGSRQPASGLGATPRTGAVSSRARSTVSAVQGVEEIVSGSNERSGPNQPTPSPDVREGDATASSGLAAATSAGGADATPTTPRGTAPAPESSDAVEDPDLALYRAAHRAHFVTRDPRAALAAWDRYLAEHPQGTFALEARYNRALCLVRLGRSDAAERALLPFASGSVGGGYRRAEAQQLLDALRAR